MDSDQSFQAVESGSDQDIVVKKPAQKEKVVKKIKLKKNTKSFLDAINDKSSFNKEDEDSNESKPTLSSNNQPKTLEQIYQKKTQLEHILLRPDTYIGSVEHQVEELWIYNEEKGELVEKEIKYVPGLYKIFDEILVNAADNKIRSPDMNKLKVAIEPEANIISIFNNGKGIPVEMHKEEKVYIPELIFGHLLTSSNYDDKEKKVVGGRNGYGAKLCNIFSTEFTIETGDSISNQKYVQTFKKNMSVIGKPKITKYPKGESYTKITFQPDLKLFHMNELDLDTVALLKKRVIDMSGTLKGVNVYLNNKKIASKGFSDYCKMYIKSFIKGSSNNNDVKEEGNDVKEEDDSSKEEENEKDGKLSKAFKKFAFDDETSRWEVGFVPHDKGTFQQISFVNSICTSKGGTHVKVVTDKIVEKIEGLLKKKKDVMSMLKAAHIRNNICVFVNCLIENPAFDSQTKETLKLKPSLFGSEYKLSEKFEKKIKDSGIVDIMKDEAEVKAHKKWANTMDSKKRIKVTGIDKLDDANFAGTRNAKHCTLILTEGDSAKTLAMSGLTVVGRDYFGVYPLRGKILNVRDASSTQVTKNKELKEICTILGLNSKKKYEDANELRYGHIMIMTDQDHDGSHIKGLLINYLDHFYPSLLGIPNFLQEFITPIVKAYKGKNIYPFYTLIEYKEWKDQPENKKHKYKYFKGLATSTSKDAKEYFNNLETHKKLFNVINSEDRAFIDLAFNRKKAEERKRWLENYIPGVYLDQTEKYISYSDFINKELIHFSIADNIRSIPSVMDGLKTGQRKILYGCLKRNLKEEIRVAQLSGYISEKTGYHHGEASLNLAIVNMAQKFVGSNNLNLLEPIGIFGSRSLGGNDAGQARYINTHLNPIVFKLFHKDDMNLLNYLNDDGTIVEPEYYVPILPLILINGAEGIGTGWSTNIPMYNPKDIITNIRRIMNNQQLIEMIPWYRGFNGEIKEINNDNNNLIEGNRKVKKYVCNGIIKRISETKVKISELPIALWTHKYKLQLEEWIIDKTIIDYQTQSAESLVDFEVELEKGKLDKMELEGLEKSFKLSKTIATSNMTCFNGNNQIKQYSSSQEIIIEFYHKRIEFYLKRKAYLLKQYTLDYDKFDYIIKFIKEVNTNSIKVFNVKRRDLVFILLKKEYPIINESDQIEYLTVNDMDTQYNTILTGYNYLLKKPIDTLTYDEIANLENKRLKLEQQLKELSNKSEKDLWNEDLEEFIIEWDKALKEDELAIENELLELNNRNKNNGKKNNTKITRPRVKKEVTSKNIELAKKEIITQENLIQDKKVVVNNSILTKKEVNNKNIISTAIKKGIPTTPISNRKSTTTTPSNKDSPSILNFITKKDESNEEDKRMKDNQVTDLDTNSDVEFYMLPLRERMKLANERKKKNEEKIIFNSVEVITEIKESPLAPVSKRIATKTKKLATKDEEEEEIIQPKRKYVKKTKKMELSDDDDNDEANLSPIDIKPAAIISQPRPSRRAAAVKKSYVVTLSDDEEEEDKKELNSAEDSFHGSEEEEDDDIE